MVFQVEHDAALLGLGDALANAIDTHLERVIKGVARNRRLNPTRLHQRVKRFNRIPAAAVQPNGGNPHRIGQLDAMLRMLHISFEHLFVGIDEALVNGESAQVHTGMEGMAFQVVDVRFLLALHLPVQHFDRHAELPRMGDHILHWILRRFEMPVAVTGDRQLDRCDRLAVGRFGAKKFLGTLTLSPRQ